MINNLKLEQYINQHLNTERIRDIASNGLQIEGIDNVNKIALGVSVSMDFLEKAVSQGADSVLVHHGLFWGAPLLIRSYSRKRIKFILNHNLNLFAYHLPLDLHKELGNNAGIVDIIKKTTEVKEIEEFGYYKGKAIGYKIKIEKTDVLDIKKTLTNVLGKELNFINNNTNKLVESIAIVSGGASELLDEAINKNVDLFISGEISEQAQAICFETGIKYLALGHYNSEKQGVQLLGKYLEKELNLKTVFIDIPNNA